MRFISTLLATISIALAIGTLARIVWFGFTMWGPL